MGEVKRRWRGCEFTERDAAVLEWVGEMYGARVDVLGVLLGRYGEDGGPVGESAVRKQVARWEGRGLAVRRRLLGHTWVTLTRAGLDAVDQSWPVWKMPVTRLAHVHAVNRLRLAYEADGRDGWVPEREVYRERGELRWHLHDAMLHEDDGSTGIEVELSHKPRRDYRNEVFGNLRAGAWPVTRVAYFVVDERFRGRLMRDIEAVGPQVRWSVSVMPQVAGVAA